MSAFARVDPASTASTSNPDIGRANFALPSARIPISLPAAASPPAAAADPCSDHLRAALGALVNGLLADKNVTDVYLNPPEQLGCPGAIWVVRHGEEPVVCGTMTADEAVRLIAAVASTLDVPLAPGCPAVEGELFGDGPRFEGLMKPAVLAPCWAFRKPPSRVYSLAEYERRGEISSQQRVALENAVVRRLNIVVAGSADTGKTTFLNALAECVARLTPAHRLLTIENTRQLRVGSSNKVQLRTGPGFEECLALRAGLRMKPDRVWFGEVRGAEAIDLLNAWDTGHSGGACSLYSEAATPDDILLRIEQMASLATSAPQHRLLSRLVNLIVCLERDARGRRRVAKIVRVLGWDGTDYVFEEQR